MKQAWLSIGTNIEPRREHLKQAIEKLESYNSINLVNKSAIYETAPVGYLDQAHFLNMVLQVETSLAAIELLDVCQAIENYLGRKRIIRFGPRTIDLDILLYDNQNIATERLIVPHPRMHERAFVLVPLNEIASNLVIPGLNKTVIQALKGITNQDDVVKLSDNHL